MDGAGDDVKRGATPVGVELSDKFVKFRGRGADAKEERDLEENDQQAGDSTMSPKVSFAIAPRNSDSCGAARRTNRQMIENTMMMLKLKILAIPSAMQRITQRIPVLTTPTISF